MPERHASGQDARPAPSSEPSARRALGPARGGHGGDDERGESRALEPDAFERRLAAVLVHGDLARARRIGLCVQRDRAEARLAPRARRRLLLSHRHHGPVGRDRDERDVGPERALMGAAIGTGMREGELWNNELADLHLDEAEPYIFVRYGSEGKPPKNGKTRRVPLFSVALASMRRWLDLSPTAPGRGLSGRPGKR